MKKILFVDDEPNVLAAFERQLRKSFPVETALGPKAGLTALQNRQDYAVVVADMRMPEMTGVEFLSQVKLAAPDVVRMMLTGNGDQNTAIEAVNHGNIFRFLSKPCPPEILSEALVAGLRQHQLITAERELLENTLLGSVKVLAKILGMAQPKAFGDGEKLRNDMRSLAEALGLKETWEFEVAAMLSQIGTVTIPPEVVLKARIGQPLSATEQQMFEHVPAVGGDLLAQIPRLEGVSGIILYQHKRFDGTGLPHDGISGASIPVGARMLKALADLADLETKGHSRAASLEQLNQRKGWYDPDILTAVNSWQASPAPQPENLAKPGLALPFANVRVGHLLRSDVETKDGILVASAGHKITPALIQMLRNFAAVYGLKEPIEVEA